MGRSLVPEPPARTTPFKNKRLFQQKANAGKLPA